MDIIWSVWDVLAIVLILLCVHKGVEDGFLRMVVSFSSYIASALVARTYSARLSLMLYHNLIEAPLRRSIAARLEETMLHSPVPGELSSALPVWMRGLAAVFSDPETLRSLNLNVDIEGLTDIIVEQVLYEAIIWALEGMIFLVIFTVLVYLIRKLSVMFSAVYKIPVIGTLNSFMGGFLGALQAALILVAIGVVVQLTIAVSGGGYFWINSSVVDSTYIFRVFYGQIIPPVG